MLNSELLPPTRCMMTDLLPIAEAFPSIQGEGRWTGTPMFFIRFAGCNVGRGKKPFTCTRWDGGQFLCDTDYQKAGELDPTKIVSIMQSHRLKRVCFTGGEPLMHDLNELVREIDTVGYVIHVETSGTCGMPDWLHRTRVWLTLSPKQGYRDEYVRRADEIKLLIGSKDTVESLEPFGHQIWQGRVCIQPIDGRSKRETTARCLELLRHNSKLRLSIQLHKILGVR